MGAGPSDINRLNAQKYLDEIRVHDIETGGRFVSLSGEKGCGKTNVLLLLAHWACFIHPVTKAVTKETVLWRLRSSLDYWNHFFAPDFEWENESLKREVHVFHYVEDDLLFLLETGEHFVPPPENMHVYEGVADLYNKLVPGEINVICEPLNYSPSQAFCDIITKRGFHDDSIWDDRVIDPVVFWIEFLAYLMKVKKAGFYTVIMDEADEVFPQHPRDLRYDCQLFFKDLTRDLRKHNITYFLTFHTWGDLDWELTSKIMVKIWMKGARLPDTSVLTKASRRRGGGGMYFNPMTFYFMKVGHAVIERGGWGDVSFRKLKERPRVKTIYEHHGDIVDPSQWLPVKRDKRRGLEGKEVTGRVKAFLSSEKNRREVEVLKNGMIHHISRDVGADGSATPVDMGGGEPENI